MLVMSPHAPLAASVTHSLWHSCRLKAQDGVLNCNGGILNPLIIKHWAIFPLYLLLGLAWCIPAYLSPPSSSKRIGIKVWQPQRSGSADYEHCAPTLQAHSGPNIKPARAAAAGRAKKTGRNLCWTAGALHATLG